MASLTVTASCPASSAFGGSKLSRSPAAAPRMAVELSRQPRGGAVVRAQAAETEVVEKKSSGRRDIVFGAAAAAVFWSVASATGEANAADEPKKGSPEAKKLYAPVCVTMPTARICRN
ncbi:photosystem II 5 kDa protein, chloroplastic-like [Nymphaea colorata]|uniref:photosystem II 5 kDa protein, chloroplastic-like n=1 Tax=Nymphaea colorata TaxID=210225 RepID=UPI00129D2CCB|nr:photosystem II 5 kDa protein, chloroplastic-like [Nymphaea colorata]